MYSAEDENVPFFNAIDPQRKNVEDWMGELENMMKLSVRNVIVGGVKDYSTMVRTRWCLDH